MVGGLVEQEHIGVLKKNLCQLDTHAPSAGELACRTLQVALTEAKSHQRALQFAHVLASAHHLQALALVGKAFAQLHVTLALVVVALSHLLLHALYVGLYLMQMGKGLLCLGTHRTGIGKHHHLWQIAHRSALGHRDTATSGLLHPGYNLQHSALAGTVLAHEGNAVAVVHHIGDVRKERTCAELY